VLEPPSSRGQLPSSAELSQMLGRCTASTRIVGGSRKNLYPSLAHRPARPRLLLPKLRTAGSCRCAGLEGYQFPKWSAKAAVSSRSSGKMVEASRARKPPASTVVSARLHLELCAVSKQDRVASANVAASAVDGATKRVPRRLKSHPLEQSQFSHTRSEVWANGV
jgi:hypothetical protein